MAEIRRRIAAAGGGPDVALVAVTKGFGREHVAAARAAGVDDLGESYAQELAGKADALGEGGRWHFVGAVQRRKVRGLAPLVHLWQTVDRLSLGVEIARHAAAARVLVQVNVTGQPQRNGCTWAEAPALVDGLRDLGLDVRGLMCVAERGHPRESFRRLAALAAELDLNELSMGMSDDFEVAVEEGSTMVRLGAALFGPRPKRGDLRRYPHPQGGW